MKRILVMALAAATIGSLPQEGWAQTPALTTVKDTVFNPNGTVFTGSLAVLSEPFLDAANKPVIGVSLVEPVTGGALAIALVPNTGTNPAGTSYTIRFYQTATSYRDEYWMVPTSTPLANPAQVVSVTPQGTPGSTSYWYWCTATNASGETLLSPSRSTTTSHATLSGTNFNRAVCATVASATGYKLYRTSTATAPSSGSCTCYVGTAAGTTIDDQSNTLTAGTILKVNTTDPKTLQQVRVVVPPTVTLTLGAAQISGTAVVQAPTATQSIVAPATSGVPLEVKGKAGNSGNVLNVYDNASTPVLQSFFNAAGDARFKDLNAVRFADQFAGADAGAKIAAAIADLPATGGTVDARGFEGAQSCTTDPLASNTKKVRLLLGAVTLTCSVSWGSTSSGVVEIQGIGDATILSFSGATPGIQPNSNGWSVEYLTIDGNGSTSTNGIVLGGAGAISSFSAYNVTVKDWQRGLSITAASTGDYFDQVHFTNNSQHGIYIAGTVGTSNFPTVIHFLGGSTQANTTAGAYIGLARGVAFRDFLFNGNPGDGLILGPTALESAELVSVESAWFEQNGTAPAGTNFDIKAVRVLGLNVANTVFSSTLATPIRVFRNANLGATQAERVSISGGVWASPNPVILDANVQGAQVLNTGLNEGALLTDNAVDTMVVERNQLVKAGTATFRTALTTAALGIVSVDTGNTANAQGLTFLKSAAGFNPMAAVRAAATNYGTNSRSDLVFHANTGSESAPSEHGRFVGATGLLSLSTGAVSPQFASSAADPADAGAVRLGNAECVAAEAAPAGTDGTLCYNAAEQFESNSPLKVTGGVTEQMGGSAAFSANSLIANVSTTAVGNVGIGEDDLITYSLPATSFNANGKGVRITAWGTTANNANAKTLKLYFGAVALTNSLTTGSANRWEVEGKVFRTGANAQDYFTRLEETGVSASDMEVGTLTQTDSGAITIKLTGEATANDDIVQEGLLVEFLQ